MNDSELDELLARYGKDYNEPPANPPLDAIRERVNEVRRVRRWRPWFAGGGLAAAAALLMIGLLRAPEGIPPVPITGRIEIDTNTLRDGGDPRTASANAALVSAVESAKAAVNENPDDPFYQEHLAAMRENADRFRLIQQRLSEAL